MTTSLLYGFFGLILLWHLVRGWRKGPARMVVSLLAMAAGYIAAVLLGDFAVPLLRPLGYPDLILLVASRVVIGLLVFLIVVLVGAVLFKRTSQQEIGMVRFVYGLSGGALGIAFGIVVVWMLVVCIRVLGSLSPPAPETPAPATGNVPAPVVTQGVPARVLEMTRTWKEELDNGPAGALITASDPLRPTDYALLQKIGRLLARPAALKRLAETPAFREWTRDERLRALSDDPELAKLVADRNYDAALRHPKVQAFLNDPQLRERVKRTDFQAALDQALEEPK